MTKSNYQRTADWLFAAGKQPGNTEHISVQIGVDAEEFAEWLSCLRVNQDGWAKVLERIRQDLSDLATAIKVGKIVAHVPQHERVNALDALCDREVTANGSAWLLGFDKEGADTEVLQSNDSKFEDGKAVILPGGKIGKGRYYKKADLKGLV